MNKLLDIFKEKTIDCLLKDNPDFLNRNILVWYPSSGYDYRHISDDIDDGTAKSKIYLHSDINALNGNFDGGSNPIFKKGIFIGRYKTKLECINIYQFEMNRDLYFPCREVLYNSFGSKREKNNGKIFCFELQKTSNPKVNTFLIYFGFENTNLFFDYILSNEIQIQELVHINDGGQSMGCSKLKMDYIYKYLTELGIRKIKLDFDIETKFKQSYNNFGHFRYFNPLNRDKPLSDRSYFDPDVALKKFHEEWSEENAVIRMLHKLNLEQYIGTSMFQYYNEKNQFDYLYLKK